jgi:hypothetical protein
MRQVNWLVRTPTIDFRHHRGCRGWSFSPWIVVKWFLMIGSCTILMMMMMMLIERSSSIPLSSSTMALKEVTENKNEHRTMSSFLPLQQNSNNNNNQDWAHGEQQRRLMWWWDKQHVRKSMDPFKKKRKRPRIYWHFPVPSHNSSNKKNGINNYQHQRGKSTTKGDYYFSKSRKGDHNGKMSKQKSSKAKCNKGKGKNKINHKPTPTPSSSIPSIGTCHNSDTSLTTRPNINCLLLVLNFVVSPILLLFLFFLLPPNKKK